MKSGMQQYYLCVGTMPVSPEQKDRKSKQYLREHVQYNALIYQETAVAAYLNIRR